MKKSLKNPKTLFTIILTFIMIILSAVNIFANSRSNEIQINGAYQYVSKGKTYWDDATWKIYMDDKDNIKTESNKNDKGNLKNNQIRLYNSTSNQLFNKNKNIYCVQHGKDLNKSWPVYQVAGYHIVKDPILVYILNMEDQEKLLKKNKDQFNITDDLKQNMIWWYLNNYDNTDTQFILSNGGISCDNYEMSYEKLEPEILKAQAYAESVNAYGIEIDINNTKINGNNLDVTVSGEFDSWDIYINDSKTYYATQQSDDKTISIPLNKFTGNKAKVAVTAKMKKMKASFYLLTNNSIQRLLVIASTGNEEDTSAANNTEIDINTEVSLQKYITKVTKSDGTVKYHNTTERKNKYADLDKNFITNPDTYFHQGKEISNKDGEKLDNQNETYKSSNPVLIEAGDTVEYTIKVYNNSSVQAKVTVKDIIHEKATMKNTEYEEDSEDTYFLCKELELNPSATKEFTVQLKYEEYIEGKIINKAWISTTAPTNQKTYRTIDADYVKMADTNVSLQKYITKVNGTDVDSRINRKATDNTTDAIWKEQETSIGTNKYDDVVKIEAGDTVSYRIHVYNNSNIKALEVIVTDTLPDYADLYSLDGGYTWLPIPDNKKITRTINNLEGGASTDFDVEVHFNVYTENVLTNTAQITYTKPNNNTEYRIEDSDYVQMKKYSVSLEKYVTEVTDAYGNNPVSYTDRENHPIYNLNGYSKEENPVKLEVGDIVKYTIKLTNTNSSGDNTNIKVTKLVDVFDDNEIANLTYIQGSENSNKYGKLSVTSADGNLEINIENPLEILPGESVYLTLQFKVEVPKESTNTEQIFKNTAEVKEIINRNNIIVTDSDGTDNNLDSDWVKTKLYQVSLEKYVSKVNGEELKDINANVKQRTGKPEHKNDNDEKTHDSWKYNNVVTIGQGDKVTYTIVVRNDSADTSVKVSKIIDVLPQGVEYVSVSGDYKKTNEKDKLAFEIVNTKLIAPGGSRKFEITVKVTESNMSVNILKNTASIDEESLSNRNEATIKDLTGNNNSDADYIQMKDIVLSGVVWNDRAFDKNVSDYNGIYDYKDNKETALSDVKVYLYRVFNNKTTLEKETTTNAEGKYTFALDYMKAPKNSNNNRWNDDGKYYSYYVVFEYDGVKYTPTGFADLTSDNAYDSNAKEDNSEGKPNLQTRTQFNNKFSTINNSSNIEYETINEQGYIPQSRYVYNSQTMGMQASTNYISLSNHPNLESDLTHINLGLRGRDTFDLELMADVYSTKVSVNGVEGEYSYGNNIVTVRNSDIIAKDNQSIVGEDAANIYQEIREVGISRVNQDIRKTDIKNEVYGDTKLEIEVTYKLTVKNPSKTDGTATKVIDYYDDRYTFIKAYDENGETLNTTDGESGNGFKSVVITTNNERLVQNGASNIMDIYVVYKLNDPTNTLSSLLTGTTEIPTFNIAEILEYKTYCADNQTEHTRGLIDIDSMPGSANEEQVRLMSSVGQATPTKNGNPTTVEYYFEGNDLTQLKYEDDTYTTPTLYFTSSDNQRTIIGTVFRDNTTTDATTRIKTGNGKLDEDEEPVYGAMVCLIENTEEGIRQRYWTTTNENGVYEFKGFLPGKYIIDYIYGNSPECVLLNQAGNVNKYSYNGEDYQSTNNTGSHGASKLNETLNFWYLYNETEGVSIATDVISRRNEVSNYVTKFIDEEMQVLNNIREGKNSQEAKVTYDNAVGPKTITVQDIISETYMYADTENMLFTVEKSFIDGNEVKQPAEFGEYIINNMNFGIAEVPVTTIDLQKHVKEFSITDATGSNVIASMKNEGGRWKLKGDVLPSINGTTNIDVSIEDDKLQGARLEVTYEISINMSTEKNFDNKSLTVPTIKGIVDYINNNLSYNESLGDNSKYWELTTYDEIKDTFAAQKWEAGTTPQGTVDAEGKQYTTIVKAKADNPLLLTTEGTGAATITLEKVLSSTDSTIEEIITSTVDSFEYSNLIEITGLDYGNVTPDDSDPNGDVPDNSELEGTQPQRDRIRTPDRYIIVPGVHHDTITSEILVIHPPTGDSSINIVYYVIAVISLVILAVGVFGIKKFVVNTKR